LRVVAFVLREVKKYATKKGEKKKNNKKERKFGNDERKNQ